MRYIVSAFVMILLCCENRRTPVPLYHPEIILTSDDSIFKVGTPASFQMSFENNKTLSEDVRNFYLKYEAKRKGKYHPPKYGEAIIFNNANIFSSDDKTEVLLRDWNSISYTPDDTGITYLTITVTHVPPYIGIARDTIEFYVKGQ